MTVTTDSKRRTIIPGSKAGERFDVQFIDADKVLLVRLKVAETKPVPVHIEKRGGFTVGVTAHTINEQALQEALAEFP